MEPEGNRAVRGVRERVAARACLAATAAALLSWMTPELSAEEQPPARDAAEIVQEGDVSQWLQHYQRERGAEWARQQREQPAPPAAGQDEPSEERK